MDERMVEVDGASIFHREMGTGRPILMVHGFPQTGHCWGAVGDRLASRFRVLMPDVPGFGKSDAPPQHDAGVVAGILFGYLDALGVAETIVLGHDWGGAFSFRMALDRPERVERLIVTNTPFRELSPLHSWYIWLFNLPVLPELAFRIAGDKIIEGFYKGATPKARRGLFDGERLRIYQDAYSDPARIRSALAYYRTVTRKAMKKQAALRLGLRFVSAEVVSGGRARRIEMPTLIVWGMRDPALPPKLLRGLARDIPQAEFIELPDCGHFVPEEAPEELAGAIDRFVP
jgi:pimeloyl-ACP methyl ester carboxylesterase